MITKSSILLLVLVTSIIVVVSKSDDDLAYRVELLAPRGFRVSAKNTDRVNEVSIWGCIYPGNSSIPLAQYTVDLILQSNGWWTYQNTNSRLNQNDTFRISFIKNITGSDGRPFVDIQTEKYLVPANATRVPVEDHHSTWPRRN